MRPEERTLTGSLAAVFETAALTATQLSWPSLRYENDIAGFAWDTFGIRLHPGQIEIAEALINSPKQRSACVACQKAGKTFLGAILASWWYTMPEGRVVLFAPRMETVEKGLYNAIKKLLRRSGVCGDCREANPGLEAKDYPHGRCAHSCPITELPHATAEKGIFSEDLREICGYAAQNPIALQGVSGRVLVLIDEAAAVEQDEYDAVDTFLGSIRSRQLMLGNANRSIGPFYDAFNSVKHKPLYNLFTIDAFQIVSYVEAGILPARGDLCSRQFIADELAKANGDVNNAGYRRKILGLFPIESEETLIPRAKVEESSRKWKLRRDIFVATQGASVDESQWAKEQGPLFIGVDPAGKGKDKTSITVVRGLVELETWVGAKLEPDEIAREVRRIADKYRDHPRREVTHIKVDALSMGEDVIDELRKIQRRDPNAIRDRIEGVRANETPPRREKEFLFVRCELWWTVRDWILAGGEIQENIQLHEELYTVTYTNARAATHAGKIVVEHKDDIKKRLKRSPDRADSLALALWDPHGHHEDTWGRRVQPETAPPPPPRPPMPRNPYGYGSGRPSPQHASAGMSARLRAARGR